MTVSENYSVTSDGSIRQGVLQSVVVNNIQRKFGVSSDVAESLVSSEKSFVKQNLDKFTAQQYHRVLTDIGLIADIERVDLLENTGLSKQDNRKPQEDSFQEHSKSDVEDGAALSKKTLSGRLIKYGALVFIVAMVAEGQLREVVYMDTVGFSLGNIPYVIGYVLMALGSFLLAVENKLSLPVKALSLLSFVGLALILLLKPARKGLSPLVEKTLALTVLLATVYWYMQLADKEYKITELIAAYQVLDEGRIVYPSKQAYIDLTTVEYEVEELINYIDMVFDVLASGNVAIEKELSLSRNVMQGAASLVMWIKYQEVLYYTQGKSIPVKIPDKELADSIRLQLVNYIGGKINKGASDRVRKIYTGWLRKGFSFDDELQYRKNKIHSSLIKYQGVFIGKILSKTSDFNNSELRKLMKSKKIIFRDNLEYSVDGHFIVITVPAGNVNNNEDLTLIMACYLSGAGSKGGEELSFVQVGGDYPNNYLGRDFWVLGNSKL